MNNKTEKILWSIAIPGFGQLLNGKYIKGLVFILLEFVINVKAELNQAIMLSFQGHIEKSISVTNFQWLMFYPCVYMFAIWDAYRDAGGVAHPLSFVLAAYLGTVGIVYAPTFKVMGHLLGPVWLPLLFAMVGVLIGTFLRMKHHA
ncbi:hypothetical protein [Alicyclobacillus ferrooxydans]|uniref:Uncharacterized protein n=1 Tax=Alicyclobacillus ferrooxydans TaxID=471514 RepID=A0A0P9C6L0_9BACL|nr:hypothetical protein [Alicyclobacillus ferrooxydans]KPV40766.1 hypothetical protein AN477_20815 [Alicyclobacillus ferrooxydans]